MQDRLHQPYRAELIPGMTEILERAAEHGALGAALSGAGPTLIAFVDAASGAHAELEQFLLQTLKQEGIEAQTLWLAPCVQGTQASEVAAAQRAIPFMERIRGEVTA
jgi:homoserine kinase